MYPALGGYLLHYHGHLATGLESQAYGHLVATGKSCEGRMDQVAQAEALKRSIPGFRDELSCDPEVLKLASGGFHAFLATLAERILRDHRSEIFLNLCPKCGRIANTPRARQCPWCYHTWFHVPRDAKPEVRHAARLIVVDSENRILLFQYAPPNDERFWATPGGRVENGESFEVAAAREASEELGLESVRLEPLGGRTADFFWGDQPIHQMEQFFLLRETMWEFDAALREAHDREGILKTHWWSLGELEVSEERIFPEELTSILVRIIGAADGEKIHPLAEP